VWYLARAFINRGIKVEYQLLHDCPSMLPYPAIAGVKLDGGAGHFIAVLGETSTQVILADPLIGKRTLPKNQVASFYHFTGFFLVVKTEHH
jgi:hypothetical protein